MKNYAITDAVKIFCNVDSSTVIHLKFHFQDRNNKRHLDSDSWMKTFFKHNLLGIMKQEYNRTVLTITEFDEEDVITTSSPDRNNAYFDISALDSNGADSPAPPGAWN